MAVNIKDIDDWIVKGTKTGVETIGKAFQSLEALDRNNRLYSMPEIDRRIEYCRRKAAESAATARGNLEAAKGIEERDAMSRALTTVAMACACGALCGLAAGGTAFGINGAILFEGAAAAEGATAGTKFVVSAYNNFGVQLFLQSGNMALNSIASGEPAKVTGQQIAFGVSNMLIAGGIGAWAGADQIMKGIIHYGRIYILSALTYNGAAPAKMMSISTEEARRKLNELSADALRPHLRLAKIRGRNAILAAGNAVADDIYEELINPKNLHDLKLVAAEEARKQAPTLAWTTVLGSFIKSGGKGGIQKDLDLTYVRAAEDTLEEKLFEMAAAALLFTKVRYQAAASKVDELSPELLRARLA